MLVRSCSSQGPSGPAACLLRDTVSLGWKELAGWWEGCDRVKGHASVSVSCLFSFVEVREAGGRLRPLSKMEVG